MLLSRKGESAGVWNIRLFICTFAPQGVELHSPPPSLVTVCPKPSQCRDLSESLRGTSSVWRGLEVKEMDDVRVLQQDFGRGTHLLGALQALKYRRSKPEDGGVLGISEVGGSRCGGGFSWSEVAFS